MITHVAVRFRGQVWSLPAPNRHHDVIRHIVRRTGAYYVDAHGDDQGFLDSAGNYLTRSQAYRLAEAAGQLRADRPNWDYELYSENLW